MSAETIIFTSNLYQYFQNISLREPLALQKLREETMHLSSARMQISPEQGQFMGLLIELLGAKKTLDIGTFTGYSALSVAYALPPDGKVVACDVSVEWTNIAKRYWQAASLSQKIDLRIGKALETLQSLMEGGEAGTFDFAFIDADKGNYDHYYEAALVLLRSGGLIAVDNVLWDGKVADLHIQDADTLAIRALNEKIKQDERVSISMIPIGDGLTLARKK